MKKTLQILLLIVCPIFLFSQTQIGSDLDGEAAENNSGWSVSLSSDGSIIAIGAITNGNSQSGHVRVYENQNNTWVQIGQDIDGEGENDRSGRSVSLSSDGSIVAIGASTNLDNGFSSGHVRIYENQSNSWVQVGQDIDGESAYDLSGWSVSLSSDGSVVAIGATGAAANGTNTGHVRIYKYETDTWVQIGQDIDGEAAYDNSGNSVSLSSNGTIVCIGAYANDGNGSLSGHVRIYENQSNAWVQIGQDIDGEYGGNQSGGSISLSSDGSIVAIGAHLNYGNGARSGHVRVYKYETNTWVQIGQDIDGEAINDESGSSVSISSDGSIVAIGALKNADNGTNSGHVRIYQNQSDAWVQIGQDIDGEAAYDQSGKSLSLSSDGSIVAIGAIGNSDNGDVSGHVRVYDLSALSIESFKLDYFSMYPNPAQNFINIELNQGIEFKKITIYNTLGQFVSSTKSLRINTGNLTSGIYYIEIETNKGKSAKKIIIE